MGKGIEAFRSAVHAWECDAVEHFTTAYYLHKISSSAMRMLIELGYAEDDPFLPTTRYFYGNFSNELHKGDVYHIEAGVVEDSESELVLGHRVIDSDSKTLERSRAGGATRCSGGCTVDTDQRLRRPAGRARLVAAARSRCLYQPHVERQHSGPDAHRNVALIHARATYRVFDFRVPVQTPWHTTPIGRCAGDFERRGSCRTDVPALCPPHA